MKRLGGNSKVWVKLTEAGKMELRRQRAELYVETKSKCFIDKPTWNGDSEGWSEWVLWELMNQLGPMCVAGADFPFSEFQLDEPVKEEKPC